ncbi:citrate lyase subunit beta-like protein, mitochondrial, partial [Asbolus verrucosus]
QPLRHYTPRRALLYVPASDLKKLKKALGLDIDCITMDCEDGVALNKKAEARANIRAILDEGKPEKKRKYDLAVRVNGMETPYFKEDIASIAGGNFLPDTIVLPKVHGSDDLKAVNSPRRIQAKLQLIITIESALAFVNLEKICRSALELARTSKFIPVALLFGSDDFLASIGTTRTESSLEALYARQKLVIFAKAFNLQVIDMVYIKYKDMEGLQHQSMEGVSFGFTGKQIVHPGQIQIVQETFFPSQARIEWAANLLKAFHQHQQDGKGAFSYDGNMIDMPTVKQAQNIMDLVKAVMTGKDNK